MNLKQYMRLYWKTLCFPKANAVGIARHYGEMQ